MITFHLFYAGVDGINVVLYSRQQLPRTLPLLALSKGRTNPVGHDIQRYEASIRDIVNHTLYL
jgi:hypothetical protein